jgi:DNA polymerase III epsilon subunit-like protein
MREGKPLRSVIGDFLKSAEKARCLVGHNVVFDQKVIGAELCRLGIKDTISTVKAICTMEVGKDFCKIPGGYYGYKPPKLQELHQKLFGTTFDNAHDAMADVKATKRCFFELKRLDIPELIFQEGLALLN